MSSSRRKNEADKFKAQKRHDSNAHYTDDNVEQLACVKVIMNGYHPGYPETNSTHKDNINRFPEYATDKLMNRDYFIGQEPVLFALWHSSHFMAIAMTRDNCVIANTMPGGTYENAAKQQAEAMRKVLVERDHFLQIMGIRSWDQVSNVISKYYPKSNNPKTIALREDFQTSLDDQKKSEDRNLARAKVVFAITNPDDYRPDWPNTESEQQQADELILQINSEWQKPTSEGYPDGAIQVTTADQNDDSSCGPLTVDNVMQIRRLLSEGVNLPDLAAELDKHMLQDAEPGSKEINKDRVMMLRQKHLELIEHDSYFAHTPLGDHISKENIAKRTPIYNSHIHGYSSEVSNPSDKKPKAKKKKKVRFSEEPPSVRKFTIAEGNRLNRSARKSHKEKSDPIRENRYHDIQTELVSVRQRLDFALRKLSHEDSTGFNDKISSVAYDAKGRLKYRRFYHAFSSLDLNNIQLPKDVKTVYEQINLVDQLLIMIKVLDEKNKENAKVDSIAPKLLESSYKMIEKYNPHNPDSDPLQSDVRHQIDKEKTSSMKGGQDDVEHKAAQEELSRHKQQQNALTADVDHLEKSIATSRQKLEDIPKPEGPGFVGKGKGKGEALVKSEAELAEEKRNAERAAQLYQQIEQESEQLQAKRAELERVKKHAELLQQSVIPEPPPRPEAPAPIKTDPVSESAEQQVDVSTIVPETKTQEVTSEASQTRPKEATAKRAKTRSVHLLSEQSIHSIKQELDKLPGNWNVGEPVPHARGAHARSERRIVTKSGKEKFQIHDQLIKTKDSTEGTFIAMMKAYRAACGNLPPKITTSASLKSKWEKAYKVVYGLGPSDLVPAAIVHVRTAAATPAPSEEPPASSPPSRRP